MPDVLVRGLSERAVARFDEEASALGVSRAEVLRRHLETEAAVSGPRAAMTAEDWQRFAEGFADLAHPDVMSRAWG